MGVTLCHTAPQLADQHPASGQHHGSQQGASQHPLSSPRSSSQEEQPSVMMMRSSPSTTRCPVTDEGVRHGEGWLPPAQVLPSDDAAVDSLPCQEYVIPVEGARSPVHESLSEFRFATLQTSEESLLPPHSNHHHHHRSNPLHVAQIHHRRPENCSSGTLTPLAPLPLPHSKRLSGVSLSAVGSSHGGCTSVGGDDDPGEYTPPAPPSMQKMGLLFPRRGGGAQSSSSNVGWSTTTPSISGTYVVPNNNGVLLGEHSHSDDSAAATTKTFLSTTTDGGVVCDALLSTAVVGPASTTAAPAAAALLPPDHTVSSFPTLTNNNIPTTTTQGNHSSGMLLLPATSGLTPATVSISGFRHSSTISGSHVLAVVDSSTVFDLSQSGGAPNIHAQSSRDNSHSGAMENHNNNKSNHPAPPHPHRTTGRLSESASANLTDELSFTPQLQQFGGVVGRLRPARRSRRLSLESNDFEGYRSDSSQNDSQQNHFHVPSPPQQSRRGSSSTSRRVHATAPPATHSSESATASSMSASTTPRHQQPAYFSGEEEGDVKGRLDGALLPPSPQRQQQQHNSVVERKSTPKEGIFAEQQQQQQLDNGMFGVMCEDQNLMAMFSESLEDFRLHPTPSNSPSPPVRRGRRAVGGGGGQKKRSAVPKSPPQVNPLSVSAPSSGTTSEAEPVSLGGIHFKSILPEVAATQPQPPQFEGSARLSDSSRHRGGGPLSPRTQSPFAEALALHQRSQARQQQGRGSMATMDSSLATDSGLPSSTQQPQGPPVEGAAEPSPSQQPRVRFQAFARVLSSDSTDDFFAMQASASSGNIPLYTASPPAEQPVDVDEEEEIIVLPSDRLGGEDSAGEDVSYFGRCSLIPLHLQDSEQIVVPPLTAGAATTATTTNTTTQQQQLPPPQQQQLPPPQQHLNIRMWECSLRSSTVPQEVPLVEGLSHRQQVATPRLQK